MQHSLYLLPAAAVVLFLIERYYPLRKAKGRLSSRLLVNAVVSALAVAAALLVVRPVALGVLQLVSQKEWGVMQVLPGNGAIQAIATFMLLDLSFYYWHRANHAWPLLWRFHNTHHIDPDLDVSTAVRFHFVEIVFSAAFRVLQVTIIGGPVWAFVAYETVFQLNTLFHHSNVRLPVGFERWLSIVIVTPRMHGIHHSKRFHEINSNWSSVFSWWDRLHRTLRLDVPQSAIDIGVAGYSLPQDNSVRAVLIMPFRMQRDYWRDTAGRELPRRPATSNKTRMAQ